MTGPGSRASELFLALADVPAEQRAAWLDEHCGDDRDLRREVEALLASLDAPDDFLDPEALHPQVLDSDAPLPPGTRIAEFTIHRVVGTGSAGIVYVAQQRHPQRTVALKVLRRGLTASSARRRFEVEAELLGHLQHPGIAQIYAAHPGDDTIPPFIAMEFVDGPSITDYVRDQQLDVRAKVELIIRVCEAVQHAHQRGVIHRDLKPANVLVGRDGAPKILDFGVARRSGVDVAVSTVTTAIGQLIGTVAFMSPEQVSAIPSEVDTRSDVYAVGVILFRLLAGRLPFTEDDPPLPELARRIAMNDPPKLSSVDRSLGGDLETIVATALAKQKERRYQSAADFAADLRRWLSGQPIAASTDNAWSGVRHRLVRYRRALMAGVAIVLVLGGLATYALVQRKRAEATNVQLGDELASSNIERARLLGMTGNLRAAEAAIWHELFTRPDSRHAQWALWELYAREPSLWTRVLHPGGANTVYVDNERGRLITAGLDSRIRVVDIATGDVQSTLNDTAPEISDLVTLPGTGDIVSLSADGSLRVWDGSGTVVRTITIGPRAMGLAPAGPDAVAASADGRVRIWSVKDGQTIEQIVLADDERPTLIDVSSDRTLVAIGTESGALVMWDRRQRRVLWRRAAHRGRVSAVRFSPTGTRVATGGGDQAVMLHDATSGKPLGATTLANGTVRSLAFDASGRRLAAAGWWRTLLFDTSGDGLREAGGFAEPAWRLAVSSDGQLLITCTEGPAGEVRAWQVDPQPRTARWQTHDSRVITLATSGNLPTIASGTAEGDVRVQRIGDSSPSQTLEVGGSLVGLQIDTSGRQVFTASRSGELAAWDLASSQRVATGSSSVPAAASAFTGLADGSQLVIGFGNGTIASSRWTGSAFEMRFDALSEDGEVLGLAIHKGLVAAAHRGGFVVVHDGQSGRPLHRFATEDAAFTVAWSPDGRQLAVGTWTGLVEVWDLASARRVRTLRLHTRLVTGLAWATDEGLLASASRDGTVRLWDVDRGHALATLASRETGASRLQVLPREQLLIGYDDGVVEVRDLDYFFRHVAGQVEYQRHILERGGRASYPRAGEVVEWSRKILGRR